MSEFRFAQLGWIHAIWIALCIGALLVLLEFRGRSVLDQLISRMMQTRLVHRTSLMRRVTAIVLATLSMILLIVALMRPQWGRTVQQVMRVDSQIMICLDVSKSMLAEDVAPNRLERAKVELDSLLGLMRDGQQVGLIAFAGKATVLCPMTTDFGFLRLVLSEGEPESVGLGGTKIGAAIQTALDGFGEAGDIHRMILLITDGEDHDSFPLEAAKRAKEKGVRIVTVGFGDEAGSKVEITDPATGVRSFLKDRDGKEVVSRLDGETLRDIAMTTDGAYVPAGTGALDLESIYRSHIATLLKGSLESEQRVIRNEAFQWFVLAAIVLLIMSLISATPWNLRTRALVASQTIAAQTPSAVTGVAVLWCMLFLSQSSSAQQLPAAGPSPVPQTQPLPQTASQLKADASTEPPDGENSKEPTGAAEDSIDDTLPPRTIYNQALALVHTDPDRAERYLNHARSEAGTDGELRFRTLYNLGWVEVNRADATLQAEPQQALQHLHQAANRFREAIRVRPENSEARQNLEILSRRILELTDALREKNPQEIAARLDALIEQTRAHQGEIQALVQQIGRSDEGISVDAYRAEFRRLAVTERQLISDTQQFTDDARTQLDAIVKKPDEEKKPEEKLQSVQLQNMLAKIDNGIQRMNKSRSLTRRLQGDAAFRRWSSALSDLKQARDQLRNPVEVLGQIIGDATEMASLTQMLTKGSLSLTEEDSASQIPAWLTNEYIADLLSVAIQRTSELEQVFTNISTAQEHADPDSTATPPKEETPTETPDPQTEQLLKNITAATPLVRQAKELLERSNTELENKALDAAYQKQMEGISELAKAWELFFDIRRLIELLYQQQQLVQGAIQQSASQPEIVPQLIGPLAEAEAMNLQRCQRLAELIQIAKDQLPAADAQSTPAPLGPPLPPGSQPPPTAPGAGAIRADANSETQQADAERQQLELAQQLLGQVITDIQQAQDLLQSDLTAEKPDTTASDTTAPAEPVEPTAEQVPQPEAQPEVAPEKPPEKPPVQPPVQPPGDASSATAEPAANESTDRAATAGPLGEVGSAVDRSLKSLEELRRLFFSLVEHLRDTAQRQSNLNDETTELGAKADPPQPEKMGPLAMRQQQLQNIAQRIAEALKQQSDQAATAASQPTGAGQPPQGPNPQDAAAAAEKLAQAGSLVDTAQNSMQAASQQLLAISQGTTQGKEPFALAQEGQTEALKKLLEALAVLDENNQQDQQQQQDQNQDQQQQQQDQQDQNQQQQQQQMDANQLLQLIRDREAERRKDKNRRAAASGTAVDKDW